MQYRHLGSGRSVRSLHCRYTPVLNALLPRRLAYHSHGPRLDVACSRFWRAVESASCSCSCLCLFVCCAADLPPKAVYRWNSGKLACMALPRRGYTFYPEGHHRRSLQMANARKHGGRTEWADARKCASLSPDPCSVSIYIGRAKAKASLFPHICSVCLCHRL
jgi:hypothetical protein